MSEAHIPQPNTGGMGEQIQSTDVVAPMQSIETLSPANPGEISTAVGEFNSLDPWFYTQFRRIATVQWTVNDETGKMLWYIPISPLALDKNLAYVMRMYLGWTGGFIFNFKIAGTGFHAGMLTFVKTPPTIHPSMLKDPQDYTIMPWDGADPKMLPIGSFQGRDIRPIKYHYTNRQDNAPEDYSIGGYLAMFVDMPLATSSSGVPRVNVAIWAKLNMDFRVGWMIPYNLSDVTPQSLPPPGLEEVLDFSKFGITTQMTSSRMIIDTLYVMPSKVKVLNSGLINTLDFNGSPLSRYQATNIDKADFYKGVNTKMRLTTTTDKQKVTLSFRDQEYEWFLPGDTYLFNEEDIISITGMSESDSVGSFDVTLEKDWTHAEAEVYVMYDRNKIKGLVKWADNEYAPPAANESFMVFAWADSKPNMLYSAQYTALTQYLKKGEYANFMSRGQAMLFIMHDISNDVPLGYVKFYYDGYFTTKASPDAIPFPITNIKLTYQGLVLATSAFPSNPTMASNRLHLSEIYRRQRRAISNKSSASQRHQG